MCAVEKIISNVLASLYQVFGASVVFAFLAMFLWGAVKEKGFKAALKEWADSFRQNGAFRKMFFLFFYLAMMLYRTLLCRSMWVNPVENVIGVWVT